MDNSVTKDTCDKCMADMQRQISENGRVAEKRLDAHADQIDRVDKLMERVITLQEVQTRQLEASEKRLQLLEKQVAEMAQEKKDKPIQDNKKEPFWKEKWFSLVMITACIILVIIVGAAVGQNVLKEYVDYLKTIK